ncbi:ATP-binding cassette domain-containing protein [Pseudomonadota bacterium]
MIVLEDIYKIFGTRTTQALTLAKEGVDKSEIHTTTGQNIGLANINLSFNLGKTFVIMGLSGSGKSTLLRLLNRLITPSSGRININGTDILSLSERQLRAFRRKHFGMVFQSFALFPHKTVLQNVAYGLSINGIKTEDCMKIASGWLETVGLEGYAGYYPQQLSGGMKHHAKMFASKGS